MGGGGDRMPFETLHSKDIKMPHVYHISSQTGGTHYKKRFQTLQTLLYTQNSHFGHLPLYASSFCPCPSFPPPPSSSSRAPLPLSLPLPLPGPLPLSLSLSLSLPLSLSPSLCPSVPLPLSPSHPHFHFHFHFHSHSHSHSYSRSTPPSLCPSLSLCSLPLPLSLCPSQSHKTNANEDCSPPPRVTSAQSPLVTTAHTTRCAPWLIIPKPPPPRRAVARARVDPERP